ncbi:MAG: hypothetical protein ABSE49_25210 [Polyangiaceae bacterium]|jgi:hypothetical protein
MKRLLLGIAMLGAAAVLWGCPIYGNENRVCQGSSCYSCPDSTYSGACINWTCSQDSDCDQGYLCDQSSGTCYPGSTFTPDSGADAPDDCSVTGCPTGQVCKLSNGVAQCVDQGSSSGSSSGGSSSGGSDGGTGSDSSAPGDSGAGEATTSGDASSGSDSSSASDSGTIVVTGCNNDGDCTTGHCVDGACVSQVNLCSDTTQCNVSGYSCVNGTCEPLCSSTQPCPSGYGCDFTRGVCNLNPTPCSGSGTSTCQGGAVCVEAHCVPPCSTAEGGAACAAGQVCVNGGCIPDQGAKFACENDGDEGQLSNNCPATSICLHHDCYPACDLDAVAPGCTSGFSCIDVTIETGIYAVCAAPGTLGSQCDPAQGKACATGVCINGTCE